MVSPLSDPNNSPFWKVISDGCSTDPSLTLVQAKDGEEDEADGEPEEEREEGEGLGEGEGPKELNDKGERSSLHHKVGRGRPASMEESEGAEEAMQSLRFSFILRPVYNVSMQFLHCSLRLCVSNRTGGKPVEEAGMKGCQGGLRIPPLVFRSPRQQVHRGYVLYTNTVF